MGLFNVDVLLTVEVKGQEWSLNQWQLIEIKPKTVFIILKQNKKWVWKCENWKQVCTRCENIISQISHCLFYHIWGARRVELSLVGGVFTVQQADTLTSNCLYAFYTLLDSDQNYENHFKWLFVYLREICDELFHCWTSLYRHLIDCY